METQPVSLRALPGPDDIFRRQMPNGITLLSRVNTSSPAVVIRGYLQPGTITDPADKTGLSFLTRSMLSAGTRSLAFSAFHEQLEGIGASLKFGVGPLATTFSGQCLKEDLPLLLSLLRDALENPAFPPNHFRRIQAQQLASISLRNLETAEMASDAFDRLFYREHPYARVDIGDLQSVTAITLDDVMQHHAAYSGPMGMVIAVVGGISTDAAWHISQDALAAWANPHQQSMPGLPPLAPLTRSARAHVELAEKSQMDLVLGTTAPVTTGPEYEVCMLGNQILGQYGMMGRIGESVREKAGLAYYAYSALGSGLGPASWQVMAGVNPANLEQAIELIKVELARFIAEPVTEKELDDVRSQTLGRLPISLETNASVANTLLSLERYQQPLDHLRTLPQRLNQITPDQILEAARHYWDLDKLVIASSGTMP